MGKQINYWLLHEDFLQIAQAALDCGCVIVKPVCGKLTYGQSLDIITADHPQYYFHLPEAGRLMARQIPFQDQAMPGYNAVGNTVIEGSFSLIHQDDLKITRGRLFTISGYYNENGDYILRPECLTKVYHKLVRTVKKAAPYTELTDYIPSYDSDDSEEKEWKHKEYVSPSFLALRAIQKYELVSSL